LGPIDIPLVRFFLQFVFAQLLAAALVKSQWTCRVASGQELEVEGGMVLEVLLVLVFPGKWSQATWPS